MPSVSICIPSYKNPDYLIRSINSIIIQSFKEFEIIISDDTPDDTIEKIVKEKYGHLNYLKYYRNETILGSTSNWNRAISMSNTNLVKLLHHDDWFANENSLKELVAPIVENPEINFVFCQANYFDNNRLIQIYKPANIHINSMRKEISYLLYHNLITSPSLTLYRKTGLPYDETLTWLPDADFYVQYLKNIKFHYIEKPLVNMNVSQQRLTTSCQENLCLLVQENLYLLKKYGGSEEATKNILKYFRIIIRNFKIYDTETLYSKCQINSLPSEIDHMIMNLNFTDRIGDSLFRFARSLKRKILSSYRLKV